MAIVVIVDWRMTIGDSPKLKLFHRLCDLENSLVRACTLRPFAAHRDAISELVGEVIENAIEDRLRKSGVTYRKMRRAEKIPGSGRAPDFCIPDEVNPSVIIEAKITSDDGTARDKVTRIKELEAQRNRHVAEGRPYDEVVACIDGRGFRQRREDMRQLLLRLEGKVFTMASLDNLVPHTRIREFVSVPT